MAFIQRGGGLKSDHFLASLSTNGLSSRGIKVSNGSHLSNAAAHHLQIVIFKKQQPVFLFPSNTTFYPKKVFQKIFLLVLVGTFFLPCSTLAPGWFAWLKDRAVNKQLYLNLHESVEWTCVLSQSWCSQLFSSRISLHPHSSLQAPRLGNFSDIYVGYNMYDTSCGCWVHSLYHCTAPALRIQESRDSIHSPEIRFNRKKKKKSSK